MCFFTSGEIEDSTNKPTRKFAKILWAGVAEFLHFFYQRASEKSSISMNFSWSAYKSVSVASKRMSGHKKSIAYVCSGKRKSSEGSIKCFKKGWFFHPFLFATIP